MEEAELVLGEEERLIGPGHDRGQLLLEVLTQVGSEIVAEDGTLGAAELVEHLLLGRVQAEGRRLVLGHGGGRVGLVGVGSIVHTIHSARSG